ncbi:MAG TPA: sensor histidine kinase [Candidatus Dormibacteraeota bacterium]
MRLGHRQPRRRDPRRRFRNRLLLGMVVVALLPLVVFSVLAVFELDTVAKSTANATEAAILQRQEDQQHAALGAQAAALDGRLHRIDAALLAFGRDLTAALRSTTAPPPLPPGFLASGGARYLSNLAADTTLVVKSIPAVSSDIRFGAATVSQSLTTRVANIQKEFHEISSIWIEDGQTGALRTYPAFPVPSAFAAHRYNIGEPGERDGLTVFLSSEGGINTSAPNLWFDPNAAGNTVNGPFWTDPYQLLADGSVGVSARLKLDDNRTYVGVDVSPVVLISSAVSPVPSVNASSIVVSASGAVVYAGSKALTDFPSTRVGRPLIVPPKSGLGSVLHRAETTGVTPTSPVRATLDRAKDDVFAAPIYGGHWIITSQVALTDLEPNLSSLTLGLIDSVHRLFPVMVLPVLVLLVVLAFIATTLLSRRMYLPVQALTDHAVLEERTRLAREIHDTLAQQLTGIVLELEAADTLLNRGSERRAKGSVEKARELARAALQEARRSVWNLRPAPLSATGLVAAIGHEVEAWEERTGIPARFKARAVPQHPSLAPIAEVALLRIGQEALSNVARHGRAEHVDVELRAQAQELILSVRDDGVGFDPAASAPREDCFGLDGMAERARNAGGTLTVVSSPGHGTTVTTRLPLTEAGVEANTA